MKSYPVIWVFPKIVGKHPKWMVNIRENPIKMDDLGVHTPICGNTHMGINYFISHYFWIPVKQPV